MEEQKNIESIVREFAADFPLVMTHGSSRSTRQKTITLEDSLRSTLTNLLTEIRGKVESSRLEITPAFDYLPSDRLNDVIDEGMRLKKQIGFNDGLDKATELLDSYIGL